jgi:hypothetical protein
MKRRILVTICFWQFSLRLFAQQEASGLLIYQEPAGSYAEAIEYHSAKKDNALYTTVVTPDGSKRQFKTAGVIALVDYPPFTFDPSFPDTAKFTLSKLDQLAVQLPRVKTQLDIVRGKWKRALSVYNQTPKLHGHAVEVLPDLTVKGSHYSNVRLVEANAYTATISHANGVARLPLDDLSIGQMVRLNTTSSTAQLATRTADLEETVAPARQGGTLTYRVGTAGEQVLGFIAGKIGIPYWKISVWLLFVILPVLVLALLVLSFAQSRKLRRLNLFPKIRPRL